MEIKLLEYFRRIMPISEEEIAAIVETLTIRKYKEDTTLLKEGQMAVETYFVLERCVRQYFVIDGEEKTTNFFTEEQWVVNLNTSGQTAPSNHYLECSVDCSLVVGNRSSEESLYKRFPNLETISRKVMEQVFGEQQELMASYTTDTPEQRYLKLMKTRPYLFQLIPQYKIASYIGVKPESLSRIRKRIMSNKGEK